jgi:hypothetical protein
MKLAWTLIALVSVGPPVGARSTSSQVTAGVRWTRDGEKLFRTYRAACHGVDARGNGPVAAALTTPPSDLTLIAASNGGSFERDRLVRYIADGTSPVTAHGSKEMPVWGANLMA